MEPRPATPTAIAMTPPATTRWPPSRRITAPTEAVAPAPIR